jgi:hypothetical protein
MSYSNGPRIVTDGLVLCLDAGNSKSYSGSGTSWNNLATTGSIILNAGQSFSTNNKGYIVFNGTTDAIFPSTTHSYLSSSCLETTIYSVAHSGAGNKTIIGYRHNAGYVSPTIGSIYLNGNTLSASVITTTQVYRIATSSLPVVSGQWYHICLNKDTTNGSLELFVNGISRGSQTFDVTTYAQWPSSGNYIGANILDIGKSTNTNSGQGWSADYFNGYYSNIKLYSRILTSGEILQNYNSIKGRFNL